MSGHGGGVGLGDREGGVVGSRVGVGLCDRGGGLSGHGWGVGLCDREGGVVGSRVGDPRYGLGVFLACWV